MSEAQSPRPTRARKAAPHNTVVVHIPFRIVVDADGLTTKEVFSGHVPVREPVIDPPHLVNSASDLGKWGIVVALIVSSAVSVMVFGTLFLLGKNAGVF